MYLLSDVSIYTRLRMDIKTITTSHHSVAKPMSLLFSDQVGVCHFQARSIQETEATRTKMSHFSLILKEFEVVI